MEYDLSYLVETLRQQKNLTVNELCEGIISKSTYSRFVNGHTIIKADIFLQLGARLNMTFAMFAQDYLDFFKLKHDYTELLHAMSYQEYDRILNLIDDYETMELTRIYDQVFLRVAKLLLDEVEGRDIDPTILQRSQAYFLELDQWTDYDCKAFKNIMHLYPLSFNLQVLKRLLGNFDDLTDPYIPEEIYYIVGPNVHRLLQDGEHEVAERLFAIQKSLFVGALDPARSIYNKATNALLEMVVRQNVAYLFDYEAMLELYHYLGSYNSVRQFTELYQYFEKQANLPPLSVSGGVEIEPS